MSQTAQSWLDDLNSLYTPLATHFDAAESHRYSIEYRLDYDFGVSEMFEIGSLRHGTGIWQFSDADYLVALEVPRPQYPDTMLDKVKSSLQARFPGTTTVTRRPAVVCQFSDCDVEVVPGYRGDYGYWIADPTGGWMLTHPKDHNEYVNKVNNKHNGAVKKLARQLKVWKYKRNVPISSCYLEMRAAKYMEGETAYVPLIDLARVLRGLRDVNLASMNDPTGLGSRFNACSSDSNRIDALSKLGTAVDRADKALSYWNSDNHDKAIEQLKLLFNR